jgi:hypothetical protein
MIFVWENTHELFDNLTTLYILAKRGSTSKGKVEKVYLLSTIKRNLLLREKSKSDQTQILKGGFLWMN